jgi:hypothetical protein
LFSKFAIQSAGPEPPPVIQLKRTSTADDSQQDNHNGDYQKDVDKTTQGIGRDQSKYPQDKQNNSNRIKHGNTPLFEN